MLSYLLIIVLKIEDYMLPCPWKKTFGIDCLGCGMQRSFLLVFKGEFTSAFKMYPAVYTLLIMFSFLLLHLKFKFAKGHLILIFLFTLNISIIVISYILKFINL